jgi:PST family polysaccharide transporter
VALKKFFKKILIPFSLLIFVICLGVFIFSSNIVFLLLNKQDQDISLLMKILSTVPIIVVLNIAPYQTLLAYNQKKTYSKIIIYGAILNITSNIILSNLYGAIGTAISIIITELFITIAFYYSLKKFERLNLNSSSIHTSKY